MSTRIATYTVWSSMSSTHPALPSRSIFVPSASVSGFASAAKHFDLGARPAAVRDHRAVLLVDRGHPEHEPARAADELVHARRHDRGEHLHARLLPELVEHRLNCLTCGARRRRPRTRRVSAGSFRSPRPRPRGTRPIDSPVPLAAIRDRRILRQHRRVLDPLVAAPRIAIGQQFHDRDLRHRHRRRRLSSPRARARSRPPRRPR